MSSAFETAEVIVEDYHQGTCTYSHVLGARAKVCIEKDSIAYSIMLCLQYSKEYLIQFIGGESAMVVEEESV